MLLRSCRSHTVFFSGLMRFPASDRRAYARPDPVLPEPLAGRPVGFRFGIQPALELCSRHQACLSTLGFAPPSPQQLSCFFAPAVFSSFACPWLVASPLSLTVSPVSEVVLHARRSRFSALLSLCLGLPFGLASLELPLRCSVLVTWL